MSAPRYNPRFAKAQDIILNSDRYNFLSGPVPRTINLEDDDAPVSESQMSEAEGQHYAVQPYQRQMSANQPILKRSSAKQSRQKQTSAVQPGQQQVSTDQSHQRHTSAGQSVLKHLSTNQHSSKPMSEVTPSGYLMPAAQASEKLMSNIGPFEYGLSAAQPHQKQMSMAHSLQQQMSGQRKRPYTGEASPIPPIPAKKPRPITPRLTNSLQHQGALEEHGSVAKISRLKCSLVLANEEIKQSASEREQRVTRQDTDTWRDRVNAYQQENERLEALLTKRDAEIASLKGRNAENTQDMTKMTEDLQQRTIDLENGLLGVQQKLEGFEQLQQQLSRLREDVNRSLKVQQNPDGVEQLHQALGRFKEEANREFRQLRQEITDKSKDLVAHNHSVKRLDQQCSSANPRQLGLPPFLLWSSIPQQSIPVHHTQPGTLQPPVGSFFSIPAGQASEVLTIQTKPPKELIRIKGWWNGKPYTLSQELIIGANKLLGKIPSGVVPSRTTACWARRGISRGPADPDNEGKDVACTYCQRNRHLCVKRLFENSSEFYAVPLPTNLRGNAVPSEDRFWKEDY